MKSRYASYLPKVRQHFCKHSTHYFLYGMNIREVRARGAFALSGFPLAAGSMAVCLEVEVA